MHESVATINSPEFINLQPLDINPLMSKCEIKVLYLGENRNGTFISKEVATDMAKTLRGAPIVGYYKPEKEDFADHGEIITIDDEGIHFECATKPYGFVAPDAQVWFQTFVDTNDFGEQIEREYLMTTGFLWTGQYEECKAAVEGEGKPHSMELDGNSIEGHWAENQKGMDFFIITDATFSKLCILGDDVEPCFEGSKVSAPEVSATFTKVDDNFKNTLYSMMQDLKAALGGGQTMANEATEPVVTETEVVEPVSEPEVSTEYAEAAAAEEPASEETPAAAVDYEAELAALKTEYDALVEKYNEAAAIVEKYQELEQAMASLNEQLATVTQENTELRAFQKSIEDAKKDAMINSFVMLSDEDKKDVIENKEKYSVDEIEAKLSVICVRKKVNFDLEDTEKNHINTEEPITTFNLSDPVSSTPAWIQAVKNTQSSRK